MEIVVKAAQFTRYPFYPRGPVSKLVRTFFMKYKPEFALRVSDEVRNSEVMIQEDFFDHIYPECDEDTIYKLQCCLSWACKMREMRDSVYVVVEPTVEMGAFKTSLETGSWASWIPKENLVLVQDGEKPLMDDDSTLDECGVKPGDSLLACTSGSFPVTIENLRFEEEFDIPVSSCFESVAELKMKIHQKTGICADYQVLEFQDGCFRTMKDTSPLVAAGIVKPFLTDPKHKGHKKIVLFTPKLGLKVSSKEGS